MIIIKNPAIMNTYPIVLSLIFFILSKVGWHKLLKHENYQPIEIYPDEGMKKYGLIGGGGSTNRTFTDDNSVVDIYYLNLF